MYSAEVWPRVPRSRASSRATAGSSQAPAAAPAAIIASSSSARPGSTDSAIESTRLTARARRSGTDGPDHDDLAAGPDARQRRLPGARGAAERGRREHDQRPGADLRHLRRDGVEQLEQAAHEHEQREQRRRDTGAGRPQHRPGSR